MKITKNSIIAIFTIIIGVIIGVLVSQGTIFTFIYLGFAFAIAVGLLILIGIIDFFTKKKYFVYPGVIVICLIVAFVSGIIGFKIIQHKMQITARELIIDLKEYQINFERFPKELTELNNHLKYSKFSYLSDSTIQS